MSETPLGPSLSDLDPLPAASIGTALAAAGALVWPALLAGATSLAVLTGFVAWTRVVRALRQRPVPGPSPRRFLPLLVLAGGGWAAELVVGPVIPEIRAPMLGALALGLWGLVRHAGLGVGR